MKSRWFGLKNKAISFREKGYSIRKIELSLGVPRSTLSGWFKDVVLSKDQKDKLNSDWKKSLSLARTNAVIWHNKQKENRIKDAQDKTKETLKKIDLNNLVTLELSLSLLYLAEGSKNKITSLGNSDPIILKFFIKALVSVFGVKRDKLKCDLHLRADQDQNALKDYWSSELKIPIENFRKVSVDKRTIGKKTYYGYKGVCVVCVGNIAIQRKLVYLSKKYCDLISQMGD